MSGAQAQIAPEWVQPEIAPGTVPDAPSGVGVDERFDSQIPRDAVFYDHTGRSVRLGDLLDGERPVVLTLVYHQCASFCDMVLRAVADNLAQQPWTVGTELNVITLSIDPRDTPEVLADARGRILGRYGRREAEQGWFFLGGTEPEIARVAEAVGYRFRWDPRVQQFAHPGVFMLLRPDGRVSRYLYGLEVSHNDVRIGLAEASDGRFLATDERLIREALVYCYTWSHSDGRYVVAAWRIMRAGGILTVLVLGAVLFYMWRKERRDPTNSQASAPTAPGSGSPVHTPSSPAHKPG